jgi:hypothetical protein
MNQKLLIKAYNELKKLLENNAITIRIDNLKGYISKNDKKLN